MNQAGIVLVAMAGLWIAYLVPHRLRYRQQLLEARADDRYSENLRVLRVARGTVAGQARTSDARQDRPALHPTAGRGARGGRGAMDRPHAARDRISADAARRSAAEHAARAAHLARRSAAARRRALLTAVLVVATTVGWAVVAGAGAAIAVGLVPSVALVGVLGLGRHAVVAAARADAEWEAGAATRLPRGTTARAAATVVGRAVRPSDATTEVMARVRTAPAEAEVTRTSTRGPRPARVEAADVADRSSSAASSTRTENASTSSGTTDETTWAPVPVPRPTYTLKAPAPRREPAPLVLDTPALHEPQTEAAATSSVAHEEPVAPVAGPAPAAAAGLTGGSALDAVLARRRAAGE